MDTLIFAPLAMNHKNFLTDPIALFFILYYSRYGGFYLLIKSGVDVAALLEWIGTSEVCIDILDI